MPTVNIGRRQNLRFRGNNVIDVDFETYKIIEAIEKAISSDFRKVLLNNCDNPTD